MNKARTGQRETRPTRNDKMLHDACEAVTYAMRPLMFRNIARQATWATKDPHADVLFTLETRLSRQADIERTEPFWDATGLELTASLNIVTGVEDEFASHLVAAALQAFIVAGQDLASDHILRLAERAASWQAGKRAALDEEK